MPRKRFMPESDRTKIVVTGKNKERRSLLVTSNERCQQARQEREEETTDGPVDVFTARGFQNR